MSPYPPLLAALAALTWGCGNPRSAGEADAGPELDGASYPEPRTDLVPRVGSDAALDVATWNIENFPRDAATPALVADLIASMDLDLIAVQEIASVEAFDELVARLPDHEGALSTHTYADGTFQKVGFIYRAGLVTVSPPQLLFTDMGYEFPRPPMQVVATADDGVHPVVDFVLVTVHLKAGRGFEDRDRREAAMVLLANHLAAAADQDIVALGDFNEVVTTSEGLAIFDPFLTGTYELQTDDLAAEGKFSFVPSHAILDHVITSAALAGELAGGDTQIPPLHVQLINYEQSVSDHLPVVVSMPIF